MAANHDDDDDDDDDDHGDDDDADDDDDDHDDDLLSMLSVLCVNSLASPLLSSLQTELITIGHN